MFRKHYSEQQINRFLIVVLVALVAVSILVRGLEQRAIESRVANRDVVAPFEEHTMGFFSLTSEDKEVTIEKDNGGRWLANVEKGIYADRDYVIDLLETVNAATVQSTVEMGTERDSDYGLDADSKVTFYLEDDQDQEIVTLDVGKTAGHPNVFYGRISGSDDVVILNGSRASFIRKNWKSRADEEFESTTDTSKQKGKKKKK